MGRSLFLALCVVNLCVRVVCGLVATYLGVCLCDRKHIGWCFFCVLTPPQSTQDPCDLGIRGGFSPPTVQACSCSSQVLGLPHSSSVLDTSGGGILPSQAGGSVPKTVPPTLQIPAASPRRFLLMLLIRRLSMGAPVISS